MTSYLKKCIVKCCKNDSNLTPEKYFVRVPIHPERRKEWYTVLGLPMSFAKTFVCEDHFNLQEDCINWMYFKTIGSKLMTKKGVVPHKNINSITNTITPQITFSEKQFEKENLENLKKLMEAKKKLKRKKKKKGKPKKQVVKEDKLEPKTQPSQPNMQNTTIAYAIPTGLFNILSIPSSNVPLIDNNYLSSYINIPQHLVLPSLSVENQNEESLATKIKTEPDLDIENHEIHYPEVLIKEEIKEEPSSFADMPSNFEFVNIVPQIENAFYNEET